MRCHLCFEHATIATSVVLLTTDADRPYVMRLCADHAGDYEHLGDATVVEVPPIATQPVAA